MEQRPLGRTGRTVSAIGLGTWQLGADWGDVDEGTALEVLAASVDAGVTLFDTADVYGDGRAESIIGRFLATHRDQGIVVATKMGRRVDQLAENYHAGAFDEWNARSRDNLGVDNLDLVQLHCPPSDVISANATYDALDDMVIRGRIDAYGVSVETCDQALMAIARPHVTNVQIILNPFRLKPLDEVLPAAQEAGVAIFARVPLASGLLSGKYGADTTFAANDHRTYNRQGEAFDRGETFSGVDFETGLEAVRILTETLDEEISLPAASLAWIASLPGVTSVIPGARNVSQARANAEAAALIGDPRITEDFDAAVRDVYDRLLRESIHQHW